MNVMVYENRGQKLRLLVRAGFDEQQLPDSVVKEFGTLSEAHEMDLNASDGALADAASQIQSHGFHLQRNYSFTS